MLNLTLILTLSWNKSQITTLALIRCWSPNVTRSVVMVSWFTQNYCACAPMLYISELCEDCAVANEIAYEIDYAWASIHDNGHVITACDVWLQQRILCRRRYNCRSNDCHWSKCWITVLHIAFDNTHDAPAKEKVYSKIQKKKKM